MRYYTGIGSRETPEDILQIFRYLGKWFANQGCILRSGHADGADIAFESGCDSAYGKKEIYLPWYRFNGSNSKLILKDNDAAMTIAQLFHPHFAYLKDGAKKLQARNTYQVLGYNLDTPSDFLVCWTKDGTGVGGTGQAIRIAKSYNIPIFDFGCYESIAESKREFNNFVKDIRKE